SHLHANGAALGYGRLDLVQRGLRTRGERGGLEVLPSAASEHLDHQYEIIWKSARAAMAFVVDDACLRPHSGRAHVLDVSPDCPFTSRTSSHRPPHQQGEG